MSYRAIILLSLVGFVVAASASAGERKHYIIFNNGAHENVATAISSATHMNGLGKLARLTLPQGYTSAGYIGTQLNNWDNYPRGAFQLKIIKTNTHQTATLYYLDAGQEPRGWASNCVKYSHDAGHGDQLPAYTCFFSDNLNIAQVKLYQGGDHDKVLITIK